MGTRPTVRSPLTGLWRRSEADDGSAVRACEEVELGLAAWVLTHIVDLDVDLEASRWQQEEEKKEPRMFMQ